MCENKENYVDVAGGTHICLNCNLSFYIPRDYPPHNDVHIFNIDYGAFERYLGYLCNICTNIADIRDIIYGKMEYVH